MAMTDRTGQSPESKVFADLTITQRDTTDASPFTISVTGTSDDVLNPPTGYVQIDEFENPISQGGFTFDNTTNELIIPFDGYYQAHGWLNFRHSANNATVAIVFGIRQNDTDPFTYSPRPTSNEKPNVGRLGLSAGGAPFYVTAGTRLSVQVASDTTGTLTCSNANLSVWAQKLGAQ